MKLTLEGTKLLLREECQARKGEGFSQVIRQYYKFRRIYMRGTRDKKDLFFEKELLFTWPGLLLHFLERHEILPEEEQVALGGVLKSLGDGDGFQ